MTGTGRGERYRPVPRATASPARRWPGSFLWIGELSRDGGASWQHDETMRLTRRSDGT